MLSDLIVKRQSNKNEVNIEITNDVPSLSNTDEIKKYKNLLGEGIITQEEFDLKKKQLLGL